MQLTSKEADSSRTAGAALLLCCCCRYSGASKTRPTIFELSGGSIEKDKVKNEWDNYESSYGKEAGEGIKDRWGMLSDVQHWQLHVCLILCLQQQLGHTLVS
jgi:hypothetical protein